MIKLDMIFNRKLLLLLLLVIILSILSFIAGWWWGFKIFPPKSLSSQVLQVVKESFAQPQKEWGSVVKSAELDFTLEGQIIEIKEGVIQGNENGREITIRKNNDQAAIFVADAAAAYSSSNFLEQASWKVIKITDLAVKDIVLIRVNSPIAGADDPSTRFFRGWWVFKQLSTQ